MVLGHGWFHGGTRQCVYLALCAMSQGGCITTPRSPQQQDELGKGNLVKDTATEKSAFRETIAAHGREILSCQDEQPGTRGHIWISISVASGGRVTQVNESGSSLTGADSGRTTDCLLDAMKRIAFPPTSAGLQDTVLIRLRESASTGRSSTGCDLVCPDDKRVACECLGQIR